MPFIATMLCGLCVYRRACTAHGKHVISMQPAHGKQKVNLLTSWEMQEVNKCAVGCHLQRFQGFLCSKHSTYIRSREYTSTQYLEYHILVRVMLSVYDGRTCETAVPILHSHDRVGSTNATELDTLKRLLTRSCLQTGKELS